jgi:hypothetical protein
MPFQPDVNQELTVDGRIFRIAEHPAAPGMPYGQEGRAAVVYRLDPLPRDTGKEPPQTGDGVRALKVFKPRYRLPDMVSVADGIAPYARLAGLQVCQRSVLTPQRHSALLRQHPDLTYAVLMPWVEGPTWLEVLLVERPLSPEESLALSRSLASILAGMEQRRLAHCDLSGPNVLLPALVEEGREEWESPIALVDVEQLYGPGLARPELVPGGSPGYAHKTAPDGLWGSTADRFSGALLLGEILGWCDEEVRKKAWGESYFEPREMQRSSDRMRVLTAVLETHWGSGVSQLFQRIWNSETLSDCPTFGEWLVMLPEEVPHPAGKMTEVAATVPAMDTVQTLLALARRFEEQENYDSATQTIGQALSLVPADSGLDLELKILLEEMEAKMEATRVLKPPQPPRSEAPATEAVLPPAAPVPEAAQRPEPEDLELAEFFDDGLAAYLDGRFAETRELLGEVVRRQPDYQRSGQTAQELLEAAEKKMVSPGWRALLSGLRIVGAGLAVLAVFILALLLLHITLLRPALEESLYDLVRPAVGPMLEVKPPAGGLECQSMNERAMNAKLTEALGDTASSASVQVEFWDDTVIASAEIGGQMAEVEVGPVITGYGYLELDYIQTSLLLQLIFSRDGLEILVEDIINKDILDAGKMRINEFELREGNLSVCVVDRKDFKPEE